MKPTVNCNVIDGISTIHWTPTPCQLKRLTYIRFHFILTTKCFSLILSW